MLRSLPLDGPSYCRNEWYFVFNFLFYLRSHYYFFIVSKGFQALFPSFIIFQFVLPFMVSGFCSLQSSNWASSITSKNRILLQEAAVALWHQLQAPALSIFPEWDCTHLISWQIFSSKHGPLLRLICSVFYSSPLMVLRSQRPTSLHTEYPYSYSPAGELPHCSPMLPFWSKAKC